MAQKNGNSNVMLSLLMLAAVMAAFWAVQEQALAGDKVYKIRSPSSWDHQKYADGTGGRTPQWMVDYGNRMMNSAVSQATGATGFASYNFKAFQAEYVQGANGEWQLVHKYDYGGKGSMGGGGARRTQTGTSGNIRTSRPGSRPGKKSTSSSTSSPGRTTSRSSTPASMTSGKAGTTAGVFFTPYDIAAIPVDAIPGEEESIASTLDKASPAANTTNSSVPTQDLVYLQVSLEEMGIDKPKLFSSEKGTDQLYDLREDTRVRVLVAPEFVEGCVPDSVKITIQEYNEGNKRSLDPKGVFPFETGLLFREPTENFSDCYVQVEADPLPGKTVVALKLLLRISDLSMRKGTLLEK